jgi:hypothetical protein
MEFFISFFTLGRILGTRILLIPPNFTLIFKHKLDNIGVDGLLTVLASTHCVGIPRTLSPTLLTSANNYNS